MMYDLIGDIHGHAGELERLLKKLNYQKGETWFHPDRRVIFLGDFIDRGPAIPQTLQIVKSMADAGHALAVMGNHEYNAVAFHMHNPAGGHLRAHSIKNVVQHYKTLEQFRNNQRDYEAYLEWFMTLPLFIELDHFNVVHACWDSKHIDFLKRTLVDNRLNERLFHEASTKGTMLHDAVEDTLKGKELPLPDGIAYEDKDGMLRRDFRIRWWIDPAGMTYRDFSVIDLPELPATQVEVATEFYRADAKPVFFGHYWLEGEPALYRENVCCLDFSVAKKGKLVAYRWNGEQQLNPANLVYVNSGDSM